MAEREEWYRVVNRERVRLYFVCGEAERAATVARCALKQAIVMPANRLERVERPAKLLLAYKGHNGVHVYIEGAL